MGRRFSNNKHDSKKYYEWLDKASEDMICAQTLIGDERCYDATAFHCQQAIEKALKAYLLLKTDKLYDGHNLSWLCKKAITLDDFFYEWLDECVVLNRCYIETRYPTDIPREFGHKQLKIAYKMAQDMFVFICEEMDSELDAKNWLGYEVDV
ncbi:MAG: HEPN domain-containing protein [Oscillospiraceae bacterium]